MDKLQEIKKHVLLNTGNGLQEDALYLLDTIKELKESLEAHKKISDGRLEQGLKWMDEAGQKDATIKQLTEERDEAYSDCREMEKVRDSYIKTVERRDSEINKLHALLRQKDDEIEQLTKREVPDMSQLTHNDLFQLKALISDNGADYIINVIRHIRKELPHGTD